jgi:hypothetical protein
MKAEAATISAGRRTLILWLLAALALGYVVLRSVVLSFTYDETYTYLEHVRKNVFFLTEFDQMGGNHHLLNVWGMWISERLFGNAAWALRLPSVLAFAGFLYAALRIAQLGASKSMVIGGFLLLVAHPYLLDFFALARGYALGNAFLLLAFCASLKHLRTNTFRSLLGACTFAALAALAHIVMINFLLAFVGAWTVTFLVFPEPSIARWKRLSVLVMTAAVPTLLMLPNLLALRGAGSFNYGCDAFWSCSVASLMEQLLYRSHSPWTPLQWVSGYLILLAAILVVALAPRWRNPTVSQRSVFFVALVLLLCLIAIMLQYVWLAVPLPRTRTGLYLLPIVALLFVVALQAWHTIPRWPGLIAGVLTLPLAVHTLRSANMTHTVEWFSTGELHKAVDLMADILNDIPVDRTRLTLRTCFETSGCMGYYVHAKELYGLSYHQRSDTAFEPADLYLVEGDSHHLVDTMNWLLVGSWNATELALYRDKRALGAFKEVLRTDRFTNGDHAAEVFPTMRWVLTDTLDEPPYLLAGHIDAVEQGNTNWIGHIMEVWRSGRLITQFSAASHHQTPTYGQWHRSGVELVVTEPLLPRDSIRYRAWPYIPSPPIKLGVAEFRVLH